LRNAGLDKTGENVRLKYHRIIKPKNTKKTRGDVERKY
jgi:hypothetical protein